MPNIQEHSNNILRLRKGQNQLFWIMHKLGHGDTCFLLYVCISFLPARAVANSKNQFFVLPICLYESTGHGPRSYFAKGGGRQVTPIVGAKLITLSAHPIHTNTANDWRLAKGKQGTATI